jgi:hypothetical protein
MSSTDDTKARDAMGTLFDQILMPLSEAVRGAAPFHLRPDPSRTTYYVRRPAALVTREDFRAPSCADAAQFDRRLAALWRAAGRDRLAEQVAHFSDAARAARDHAGDQDADVSPLIYVMF